jgi:hypothetical protein
MTQESLTGPVLFCFDGSEGSRLALSGAFAAGDTTGGGDLDAEEESFATSVAEEGARKAADHGYNASAMTKESFEGIAKSIMGVADELSARLIVCGQRGRGVLRAALLGSVSHTLASHARHPILIAPEVPPAGDGR